MVKNLLCWILLITAGNILHAQTIAVKVYPDSVVSDVSKHPVGINLNFFMDGGRFPHAKMSTQQALNKMGVKFLRYPGGEKSDLYLFSTPPYKKSSPALARTTGLEDYPGVTTDSGFVFDPLDFDEFISICKQNNAEPVIVVAADNYLRNPEPGKRLSTRDQLIEHAAAWVKYANIQKGYGVKYWLIGNESWNSNNPNSTAEIYANDVIDFSKAMKTVDPSILIVANGDHDQFFKTVITNAGDYIDRICVSNYGVYNFYRGYQTYRDTAKVLIEPALTALQAMNKYASEAQKTKLKLIVAEYGSIDWQQYWNGTNDIGHAIVTFDMAGQLLLQPQIEFSCFWNTRWLDNEIKPGTDHDALDKDGNLNPTGVALSIWGNHLANKMVRTESSDPVISFSSAGDNRIIVYLVNKSEKDRHVNIQFGQGKPKLISAYHYYGRTPDDMHPVWEKKKNILLIKGLSISVFEYQYLR